MYYEVLVAPPHYTVLVPGTLLLFNGNSIDKTNMCTNKTSQDQPNACNENTYIVCKYSDTLIWGKFFFLLEIPTHVHASNEHMFFVDIQAVGSYIDIRATR